MVFHRLSDGWFRFHERLVSAVFASFLNLIQRERPATQFFHHFKEAGFLPVLEFWFALRYECVRNHDGLNINTEIQMPT